MSTTDEENRQAKLKFIKAFFKDLESKIHFLDELYNSGRRDEAKVLCSCYIDALASNLYWPEERSNYNFVRILKEYSGEEIISYIHPKMLEDAFSKKRRRKWEIIRNKILSTLRESRGQFYNEDEIIEILSPVVTEGELENIKEELWRGTYAAIIYHEVRIPSVHGFGTADGITFDNTTFKGQPAPPIEFPMLYKCLKRIEREVRNISLSTEKWFGHDYEIKERQRG